ncbi:hypothetical protein Btru_021744 [Bulinus truncatus]|nr:hypothetical protein Btru_021744 [Bulinus truncatus]
MNHFNSSHCIPGVKAIPVHKLLSQSNFTASYPDALLDLSVKSLLYILAIIVAILGNCMLLLTFMCGPNYRSKKNAFLANLTVVGLLVASVCMPVELIDFLSQGWPFGVFICKVKFFCQALSCIVGALTHLAVAVERFLDIFHPFRKSWSSSMICNCVGPTSVAYVKNSVTANTDRSHVNDATRFAPPLEAELGGKEDDYELEVVTLSDSKFPARRYDITDLGDPGYFQGWADVQGTGAANDYCRVVGKGKLRFMSCNLAGSSGQGHHYVSKLGFEAGHPNTWFMRDMDGDGRDDYCRCLISKVSSRITCMKAGQRGFYGSTTQGGNQHTFSLPGSDGCHNKRFNHVFGE